MWHLEIEVDVETEAAKDYILGDIESWRQTASKVALLVQHEDPWHPNVHQTTGSTWSMAGFAVAVDDNGTDAASPTVAPAEHIPVDEIDGAVPFPIYLPDPAPHPGAFALLQPRLDGEPVALTVTYPVMTGNRHRGNVWVTCSQEPRPESRWEQWQPLGDDEICEDRSGGYYRCKIRTRRPGAYVHVESSGHRQLADVLPIVESLRLHGAT